MMISDDYMDVYKTVPHATSVVKRCCMIYSCLECLKLFEIYNITVVVQ